jgi:hypothetical protein
LKLGVKIKVDDTSLIRKISSVSLGCHYVGAARPKCDKDDARTKEQGAMKRVCKYQHYGVDHVIDELTRFVDAFLEREFTPLSPDEDVTFKTWIDSCPYPERRKRALIDLEKDETRHWSDKEITEVKAFVKDETYDRYKHARWIMSRTDSFKIAYGPWIKPIEREVYKHRAFIKHIPESDRPKYIAEMLGDRGPYYVTDYTAFESQFVARLMAALEFRLYAYMTQHIPGHEEFMQMNHMVLGGSNSVKSRNVFFDVEARMSGEMSTSLGNGFSNLMIMLFVCHRLNCTDVEGVVEGDDGLFTLNGEGPTPADFAQLGFDIKLEEHTSINTCSFCGLVFDPQDMINVTDPLKVVMNVGWSTRQYLHASDLTLLALLRCKGLSLLAQYPNAPVIHSLANYINRVTQTVPLAKVLAVADRIKMSSYEREKHISRIKLATKLRFKSPSIPHATRELVSQMFGVSPELQIALENQLDATNDLRPIEFPQLLTHIHPDCVDYYSRYFVNHEHLEGKAGI